MTTLATKHSSPVDLERWSDLVTSHQDSCTEFRTTGALYLLGEEGLRPESGAMRVWTVDVSSKGARLKSFTEFENSRVLLELLMPELSESLIEAELVEHDVVTSKLINGQEETTYLYDAKFFDFHTRDSVPEISQLRLSDSHVGPTRRKRASAESQPISKESSRFVVVAEILFLTLLATAFAVLIFSFN